MKLTGEVMCPTCKKEHEATLDLDKFDLKAPDSPTITNVSATQSGLTAVTQVLEPIIPEVKTVTKIPSYIPKFKCKNCGDSHKNKDYSTRPKFKCEKCGQFSPDGKTCLWCDNKEFEELEDDDLDELGIEKPEEREHEHVNE